MTARVPLLLLAALVCIAGSRSAAQQVEPQQVEPQQLPEPLFKSESDLVVLHVNVFEGRSDAVPNLPKEAFMVVEDGQPQQLTFFSSADVPVAVGLVIDNSGSMIARHKLVESGAVAFAGSSHPEDEVFSLVFNEHVQFGLPPSVKFSTNPTMVRASLLRFPAGGMTAVHDAVIAGIEHLQEATHQKRVLIVLSDGKDNASQHSEDDMLQRAARSDAIIYTVSTARLSSSQSNPGLLRELAEVTGGVAYFPRNEKGVVEAFTEIAANIRRGYSLGYSPSNKQHDGRYRRVRVMVRVPGRNLRVNARDGYFAPRHPDSD